MLIWLVSFKVCYYWKYDSNFDLVDTLSIGIGCLWRVMGNVDLVG